MSYLHTTDDYGTRYLLDVSPGGYAASVAIHVRAGSRASQIGGLAHFAEHMMFKGTKMRTMKQITSLIEDCGGDINAYTSQSETCFHATVPGSHLALAYEVLGDMLLYPLFDEAEIEKERKVVLDEIRDYLDNPVSVIEDEFMTNLFSGTRKFLSTPILGTEESVSSITRADFVDFHERAYSRDNLVVAISGCLNDVTQIWDSINARSKGHFGPTKPRATSQSQLDAIHVRAYPSARVLQRHRDIVQAQLMIGGEGVSYGSPDYKTASLLRLILDGGMSRRLFQSIREDHGIGYVVRFDTEHFLETGIQFVHISTEESQIDKAKELVYRELSKLRDTKVPEEELGNAKTQFKGILSRAMESSLYRTQRLATMEMFMGNIWTPEEVFQRIDEVTTTDIQKLAQQIFDPSGLAEIVHLPYSEGDGTELPTGEIG